jgi:hypothetical protein
MIPVLFPSKEKMLAPDPSQRFESARTALAELQSPTAN